MAREKLEWKAFDISTLNPEARKALLAVQAKQREIGEVMKPHNEALAMLQGKFEALFFKQAEAAGAEFDPAETQFAYRYGLAIARKGANSKKPSLGF